MVTNEVKWSNGLYHIYEHRRDLPITYETYFDYIYHEDKAHVERELKEGLEKGEFTNTYRIQLKDGSIKTIHSFGKLLKGPDGQYTEMQGTCQDVSEIKKRELELLQKNKQLSLAEEMAQMGYWEWNPTKDIFIWSENLYKIFGFETVMEMSLDLLLTRVHPNDIDTLKNLTEEFLRTNVFRKFSYRILKPNEGEKVLEVTGQVVCDIKGKVTKFIGVTQDITERTKKEQELSNNNKLLNMATKISQMGYWQWKPTNNEIYWSKNLYELFEIELGTPITPDLLIELTYVEDRNLLINTLDKVIETKTFRTFRHRRISRTGKIKTLEIAGEILLNDTDEIFEIIGTTQDVTDQIEKETDLLIINESLEESTKKLTLRNKQLADFNHITSHNLRAPISNLNTLLGLYKDPNYSEIKEELFDKIETVIDHLTVTLDTLVETLKVKQDVSKQTEVIYFNDTLIKTKEILAAEILKTNATIKSDFLKIPKILYNKIYLESIFLNLLGNALKYRSPQRAPKINIRTEEVNGRIKIHFKDNGLGIDLKRHGHKLFGLNKVFHKHPDAKGIGLFLTKAQIEAMGGSIIAKSKVNEGTTFSITLN